MKVAYLGPQGTFSQEAAYRYYERQSVDWIMCHTITDVLECVAQGLADEGVVPIENTIEGSIRLSVDGLLTYPELVIRGEVVLRVAQNLLTRERVPLTSIREIWSIPAALAQCRQLIKSLGASIREFDSTAAAAAAVKASDRTDVAAIASQAAATEFQLNMIATDVQDNAENHTRFIVVGNERSAEFTDRADMSGTKTMLLITPSEDRSGVLANMLHVFAALDINLSWIESKPTKKRLGHYQFFIDAEAGLQSDVMQRALLILRTLGHDVRVLGSYDTKVV